LTRDVTIVPLVAVLCLMLHPHWRRRSALLAATGLAAVLPALLVYGNTSIRENLAFVFSGSNPPQDSSWGFVLRHYRPSLHMLLNKDLRYGTGLGWEAPLWYLGLALVAVGAILLIKSAARGDQFFLLHSYALVGAGVFVAIYDSYSLLREELAFLPPAAVALALVVRQIEERLRPYAHQLRSVPLPL
jgi:hypothetical protein